ncbi:MAG: hypothetical protein AAF197_02130 [Pseudomonadota bacterium]
MFKQAVRFAFVAFVWKQYKHFIVSTILLFAYLFLVSWIHGDYVTSAQLQSQTAGLGQSFLYKWLAFAIGILIYFVYHGLRSKLTPANPEQESVPKAVLMPKVSNPDATHKIVNTPELDKDPFAEIRKRKNLRSRKDFELQDRGE